MTVETLAQLFSNAVERNARPDQFLRPIDGIYEPVSTQEFSSLVRGLAQGLRSIGVDRGDRVALLSYNRIEWPATDYACQCIGAPLVPLYTSLAEPQIEFILKDCGAKVVVVEDLTQMDKVLKVRDAVGSIRTILLIQGEPPKGVESFQAIVQAGQAVPSKPFPEIKPEDLATILYTSGTTGMPKGVMLSHRNIVSNALACAQVIGIDRRDLVMSMLPLCHVFERIIDYCAFMNGACIAYPTRMEDVAQNLPVVRPTIMGAVPRFFEKIYVRVMDQVQNASSFRQGMFRWASRVGRRYGEYRIRGESAPLGLSLKYGMARRLVLRKIQNRTGGRMRLFVSGGAALSKELAEFLVSMGFVVIEGYGLTETSPVVCVNPPNKIKLGTVGPPLPGVEVKLDSDGEILVKGPNVMVGYYNRPEETAAVMSDGWFRTGDIGERDSDGYIRITDRKKDLFKTSGGKYVAPSALENALKMSPYVGQVVVVGNNRRFPAALIVPNFERVDRNQLDRPEVLKLFEKEIDKVNETVSQPERIKKFALLKQEFTIASEELTPTLKVRRRVVEERYRDIIEDLYRENA